MQLSSIDAIASTVEPVLPNLGGISSPDGAVTLLVGDIADATSVERDVGPEAWANLLAHHHERVGQIVAHHDGGVIQVERDGFMASFNSARSGLRCAIELQRAVPSGAERTLRLRLGLNAGYVIDNVEHPLGRNVVLAARIAAQAAGGEILVSATVKRYTDQDQSLGFESRGEFHFKGLVGEHSVYALSWDATAQRAS